MTNNLIAIILLVLVAFNAVLMVVLARRWAPRCLKCGSRQLSMLTGRITDRAPVKVCRECGWVEVL